MGCLQEGLTTRAHFSRLSDEKLVDVYCNAHRFETNLGNWLRFGGNLTPEIAEYLAYCRLIQTVAKAIGRKKCLCEGRESHKDLRPLMNPNPKKEGRSFGKMLRENRGV